MLVSLSAIEMIAKDTLIKSIDNIGRKMLSKIIFTKSANPLGREGDRGKAALQL